MNASRSSNLADIGQSNYPERREASDISYIYRPTPIDVDSQHQNSPSNSLPLHNNTFPLVSNRTTDTHQGLTPIEEDEMPYTRSGTFVMNPNAPVFVPRQVPGQGGQQGILTLSWRAA